MNQFIRNAGIAAASLVAALALISTAWGHAHPESTTPAKGAVVQTSPAKVEIIFVEEIQKTAGTYGITVEKDGGASVTTGAATIDAANAAHLSVALKANLAAGRYVVNWHNVSAEDGDAAEGAFSFYVKTEPTAADLVKDAELEMVGEEEEMTEPTPEPSAPTVIAPAPATTPAAAASPAAAAPALPRTGDGGTGGGPGLWTVLATAAAAAGATALAGGLGMTMRRGR